MHKNLIALKPILFILLGILISFILFKFEHKGTQKNTSPGKLENSVSHSNPREGRVFLPEKEQLIGSIEEKGKGIVLSAPDRGYYGTKEFPNISSSSEYWSVTFSGQKNLIKPPHFFFKKVFDSQVRATQLYEQSLQGSCSISPSGIEKCLIGYSQSDENLALLSISNQNATPEIQYVIHSILDNTEQQIIPSLASIGCQGRAADWSNEKKEIIFVQSTSGDSKDSSGRTDRSVCIYNYETKKISYQSSFQYIDAQVSGNIDLGTLVITYLNALKPIIIDYRNNKKIEIPKEIKGWQALNNTSFPVEYLVSDISDTKTLKYRLFDLKDSKELPTISLKRHQGLGEYNLKGSDQIYIHSISTEKQIVLFSHDLQNEKTYSSNYRCWFTLNIDTGEQNKLICDDAFLTDAQKKLASENFDFFRMSFESWL